VFDEYNDQWLRGFSVLDVDACYARLVGRQDFQNPHHSNVEPYPIVGENGDEATFDHAFAGIVLYAIEPGVFLLQQRNHLASWNPNKICIFGGKIGPNELPSAAAPRELAEETGILVSASQLLPLRAEIERRTPVPVFRAIYVVMLDRVPAEMQCREGVGILLARATEVERIENLTMLSREDIVLFLDHFHPRRVA
jgi:8-oxo-dGTP pyrophosphatase MutT (NUDIX family)